MEINREKFLEWLSDEAKLTSSLLDGDPDTQDYLVGRFDTIKEIHLTVLRGYKDFIDGEQDAN